MLKLKDGIVSLFKKVVTSIPPDVEDAIRMAYGREAEGSQTKEVFRAILEQVKEARVQGKPLCQHAGVPVFWVGMPRSLSRREILDIIIDGTETAFKKIPAFGDRTEGEALPSIPVPVVFFEETDSTSLVVDLLINGADCENAGMFFSINQPFTGNFTEVKKALLESVSKRSNNLCSPCVLGIGIGSERTQIAALSKKQLLRKLSDNNAHPKLMQLEQELTEGLNTLITEFPSLNCKTAILGVKAATVNLHSFSYLVDVSVSCWALRRGRLIWS
ncbi:MAG: fumarate hydratase [Nitrospirae bacterium]|nr:fumarate hydratase [Nitrospirota bacterium]MBF0535833.1 fumarate hydratase [Nitrospirota bacterium]MBF0617702.1 fumarate hydratase [Nitrospirota bacterium]